MSYTIGIDVGGTFTDLVIIDGSGKLTLAKSSSTPEDPSIGLLEGLKLLADKLQLSLPQLLHATDRIVHGTTVATNALLERRGARVGILTTEGHRDILAMREGLKDDRYNVRLAPPPPIVPRSLTRGIRERLRADGSIEVALAPASVDEATQWFAAHDVEAVAVCYLHAYRNSEHEATTARLLRQAMPNAYLSISSEVLPQIKEYERLCTTVVNAYVGPALSRYLSQLEQRLQQADFRREVVVMQSHGGVASIADACRLAAGSVLSGPAAGIAGARRCGRILNSEDLITFDMGGTSTDISLIAGGEAQLASDQTIAGARVALPSIDIHTLGAGGGSIAHVDSGGILHVGPQSAGARPGPACYGRGGELATVTDANLVLGYLDPQNFLGGRAQLDVRAAQRAIEQVAQQLGGSAIEAADGICRVVNTHMAEGISVVSVRRGVDPRRFTLLSFGGAAGLHATGVARLLEIGRVAVPPIASVLSAWGMLSGDLRWEYVRTCLTAADDSAAPQLRDTFAAMQKDGRQRAGGRAADLAFRRTLSMRLGEQVFEIDVPLHGIELDDPKLMAQVRERFHQQHENRYGYSTPQREPIIVNARLAVVAPLPDLPTPPRAAQTQHSGPKGERRIWLGSWLKVPVYDFDTLPPDMQIEGPAIFESATTTVLLRQAETVRVTPQGWLDVQLGASA